MAADQQQPDGTVAITFDFQFPRYKRVRDRKLKEKNKMVVAVDVDRIPGMMQEFDVFVTWHATDWRQVQSHLLDFYCDLPFTTYVPPITRSKLFSGALWLCFNEPNTGQNIRTGVSETLAEYNRAHITWYIGPTGLINDTAFSIGDRYRDMRAIVANASPSDVGVYKREMPPPMKH